MPGFVLFLWYYATRNIMTLDKSDQQLPPYFEKFLNEKFDAIDKSLEDLRSAVEKMAVSHIAKADFDELKLKIGELEKRIQANESVIKILKWVIFGVIMPLSIFLAGRALENWLF